MLVEHLACMATDTNAVLRDPRPPNEQLCADRLVSPSSRRPIIPPPEIEARRGCMRITQQVGDVPESRLKRKP